ncbi:MAG: HlyD family secretion protein [Fimbriiglobus sp.]
MAKSNLLDDASTLTVGDEVIPVVTAKRMQPTSSEMRDRVQQLRLDDQLGGAKTARGGGAVWLPWILCLGLALTWGGVALRTYRLKPEGSSLAVAADTGSTPTTNNTNNLTPTTSGSQPTATPALPEGTIQIEVKGYIVPAVRVAVSPVDASGRLIELNIKEGQLFKQGEQLARIDPTNFQFAVDEAQQSMVAAEERMKAAMKRRDELDPKSVRAIEKDQLRAQINEARAAKSRADDELKRLENIRNSISNREYDQGLNDSAAAKFRLEKLDIDLKVLEEGPRPERIAAAVADIATAQAEAKTAEARLAQAKWRLDNCVIRAPIDGTILEKKAEKGNLVNPLAFAGGSGSVCDMADLSNLEAELEIPERDIGKLVVGQTCRVRPDAFNTRVYDAVLDRIMPIANRSKSIVIVRVKVKLPADEKPGTFLKPEMGAVVSFLAPTAKKGN